MTTKIYMSVHLSEEEWKAVGKRIRVKPKEISRGDGSGKFQVIDLAIGELNLAIFSPTGYA